ncbi:hypothetical protein HYU20_03160 [Candidatus Woesearchaeota archaeon]|nr:hypothetical protein [Candidatus Woesearchaeota archaeon]
MTGVRDFGKWILRHPVVGAPLAGLAVGALTMAAMVGWDALNGSLGQNISQKQLPGLEESVKNYMGEHYQADREDNIKLLKEFGQHKSQSGISVPLFTRTDKTAAENGRLNVAVYNIMIEGLPAVSYDRQQLDEFVNKAFANLGVKVNLSYKDINAQKDSDLGQLVLGSQIDKGIQAFTLKNGEVTYDLETALRHLLEETVPDFARLRNGNAQRGAASAESVDAIAILANFKDSKAAGVEISHSLLGDDGFTLQDIGSDSGGLSDFKAMAAVVAHEVGHKIGLRHADNPLDIMSYSWRGTELIKRFPELAFSDESVSDWQQIRRRYTDPAFAASTEVVFSPKVCAGTLAFAYAVLPGEDYHLVAAVTNQSEGKRRFDEGWRIEISKGNFDERGVMKDKEIIYENKGDKTAIVITYVGLGKNSVAVAIYRKGAPDAEVHEVVIEGADCKGKLEELVSTDTPTGRIGKLFVGDKVAVGTGDAFQLAGPSTYYSGAYVITDNQGHAVERYPGSSMAMFSGIGNIHIGETPKEPGLYRLYVIVTHPKEGAELLTKTFAVIPAK